MSEKKAKAERNGTELAPSAARNALIQDKAKREKDCTKEFQSLVDALLKKHRCKMTLRMLVTGEGNFPQVGFVGEM